MSYIVKGRGSKKMTAVTPCTGTAAQCASETLIIFVLTILVMIPLVIHLYRTAMKKQRQQEEELGRKDVVGTGFDNERTLQRQPSIKSSRLFGFKAAIGVVIGLAIVVLDLLFFTYFVPVRTTTQFTETLGLLILGIVVWGLSTVAGLMRVSSARAKERSEN